MLIPNSIFQIARVASTDATREALTKVRLYRGGDGKPQAVATNGKSLVHVVWEEPDLSQVADFKVDVKPQPGFEVLVEAEDCGRVTKMLPKARKDSPVEFRTVALDEPEAVKNGIVPFASVDFSGASRIELKKAGDGVRYPDTTQLLKGYQYAEDESVRVHLSAMRLIELLATLIKIGTADDRNSTVTLVVKRTESKPSGKPVYSQAPVVVYASSEDRAIRADALIMPIKPE